MIVSPSILGRSATVQARVAPGAVPDPLAGQTGVVVAAGYVESGGYGPWLRVALQFGPAGATQTVRSYWEEEVFFPPTPTPKAT